MLYTPKAPAPPFARPMFVLQGCESDGSRVQPSRAFTFGSADGGMDTNAEIWLPDKPSHFIIAGDAQAGKSTVNEALVDTVNVLTGSNYAGVYEHSRVYRASAYLAGQRVADEEPTDTIKRFADWVAERPEDEVAEQIYSIIEQGDGVLRGPIAKRLVRHIGLNESLVDRLQTLGVAVMSRMIEKDVGFLVINGRNVPELKDMATKAGAPLSVGTIILECDTDTAAARKLPQGAPAERAALSIELTERNETDCSRPYAPSTTRHTIDSVAIVERLPRTEIDIRQAAWQLGHTLGMSPDKATVINTAKLDIEPEQLFLQGLVLSALNTTARYRN